MQLPKLTSQVTEKPQCQRKIKIIARGHAIEGASNRSTLLEILSRPGDLPHLSWRRYFLTAKDGCANRAKKTGNQRRTRQRRKTVGGIIRKTKVCTRELRALDISLVEETITRSASAILRDAVPRAAKQYIFILKGNTHQI